MVAPDSLMESPKERSSLKDQSPLSLTNGNNAESSDPQPTEAVHRQPSYVALACCISGYSTLAYDSKIRQELRSRTSSPIRIDGPRTTSYISECGNFLTPAPSVTQSAMQTQGKGMDVLNGCSGAHSPRHVGNVILSPDRRANYNSTVVSRSCVSSYTISNSRYSSSSSTHNSSFGQTESRLITPTKLAEQISPSSFIVQRVERLYGPGALAQGFYTSPRNLNNGSSNVKVSPVKPIEPLRNDDSLPVLKLLSPEFRAQLTVASRKPKASPKEAVSPPEAVNQSISNLNISDADDTVDATFQDMKQVPKMTEEKDGHYFMKLYSKKVELLEELASSAEQDLEACDNEEGCGILRSASGKARLLVAQKLNQFKGLCQKNINQLSTDDFPTTSEDLAGFWDMVMIQVDDVVTQFQKIAELKKNNWIPPEPLKKTETQNGSTASTITSKKPSIKKQPLDSKLKEASKARDEARRKLIEEKRRAMKEKKDTGGIILL